MNTFNLTLDLNKSRASSPVRLRQGDAQGTTITALVLDHGATADLTGMTAQLVMELPDGTQYYRKNASISGNSVSVLVDETQAASVSGRTANAYIQMLQGTTVKASTGSFVVEILPDALDGHTVPESYDSAIQDAIDALDEAVEQMPDMVEDVLADHPEWTTTVQDGSITKAKLATDLARDRERLQYRLANLLTNALPKGETATATDAAKTPVAGLTVYGKSTQAGTPTPSAPVAIQSVVPDSQGNISLWARGRNLLDTKANVMKETNRNGSWSGNAWTLNGVTFTVNPFGSITANGTASGLTIMLLTRNGFALPAGTYVLSGCPSGGGDSTYRIDIYAASDVALAVDYGSGVQFTLTERTVISYMRIRAPSGASLSNKTFYPMIRRAGTSAEFVPYAETVTPIPLDGHELRSLPDGTRDELTVDERGHAVLVQRVQLTTQAVTDGVTGIVGVDAMSSTGEIANGATVLYKLATPVTHDLGYVAAVPLVGPDLTAQAIPTAPMQLTYERDLNATLARLESAIATLA